MPAALAPNPFPGLRHFRTDEYDLFFGRQGQSEEILRRLRLNRFLAVVGTSGSGKSSLIRAGLLPYLFGGFMAGAGSHWRVAVIRPGSDPIGNLAHALNDTTVIGQPDATAQDRAQNEILLEVTLRRSGLGLIEAVRQAKLPEPDNVLVVVDQFEELFRFATAASAVRKQDDAAAFVKLLVEASSQTEIPTYVVVTMRSDFIGDCARFRDLPEAVTAGLYLIPRMTRDQRREAIEDPVRVGAGEISRRLVNRLLNDGGDDPDQLPSLQHALMRTWDYWTEHRHNGEPIDLEDYMAIGGISDALSRHAEEAYADLPDERHREIAKRLFQSLTEKGSDNREVRCPTKLGDIAAMADVAVADVIAVIEYFRREGRSFLTPPPDVALSADCIIDISHESLIRGWDRLKTWVEEEADSAKMYRRLAETAALHAQHRASLWHDPDLANALLWREKERPTAVWARSYYPGFEQAMAFLDESRANRDAEIAREEKRRHRELLRVRAFAGVITVLFCVAALLAWQTKREFKQAKSQEQQALEAKKEALQAEHGAVAARLKAEVSEWHALESLAAMTRAKQESQRARDLADGARKRADEAARAAKESQNMALDYASSTVRAFSGFGDYILSQHTTQDQYETLLKGATKVHDKVLARDSENFQALVMQANTRLALIRLHRVTGREDGAKAECDSYEGEARKLIEAPNTYFKRLLGAYLLAELAGTRRWWDEKKAALEDASLALSTVEKLGPVPRPADSAEDDQAWLVRSVIYSESARVESRYSQNKMAIQHEQSAIDTLLTFENQPGKVGRHRLGERSSKVLIEDMNELADLQLKEGQKEAGLKTYKRAIDLAEAWTPTGKPDPNMVEMLSSLYVARGDVARREHDSAEADKDFALAKAKAQLLDRTTTQGQYALAIADDRLGSLAHEKAVVEPDAGRRKAELLDAVRWHESALKTFRGMEERRGKNPGLEENIGVDEQNLAWDYAALNENERAVERYRASMEAYQFASQLNPGNDTSGLAAEAYSRLGAAQQRAGQSAEAVDSYKKAIDKRLAMTNLDTDSYRQLLADMRELAAAELAWGSKDSKQQAMKTYATAIQLGGSLTRGSAPASALLYQLAWLHILRGDLQKQEKQFSEAEKDLAAARAAIQGADQADAEVRHTVSVVEERQGNLWRARADAEKDAARRREMFRQAFDSHERALTIRQKNEAKGKSAVWEHNVGIAEGNLALDCTSLDEADEAIKHYRASAEAYVEAARLGPSDQAFRDAAEAYRTLGDAAGAAETDAIASYVKAVEFDRQISNADFEQKHQLVRDLKQLARLQGKAEQKSVQATAIGTYTEAIGVGLEIGKKKSDAGLIEDLLWLYVERGDARKSDESWEEAESDYKAGTSVAERLGAESDNGRYFRSVTEDRLGNLWHARAESEKDPARRKEALQRAIGFHESAAKLLWGIEARNKTAEAETNAGIAETNLAWDYTRLEDQQAAARKHYQASVGAYSEAARLSPSQEALRKAARAYYLLGQFEFRAQTPRGAHDAFSSEIKILKPIADGPEGTAGDKSNLAEAFGLRSWSDVLLGDGQAGVADANAGLAYEERVFIAVNKADACLLLGRVDEARRIYLQYADRKLDDSRIARVSMLEDLEELEKHPEFKINPRVLESLKKELAKPNQPAALPAQRTSR